MRTSNVIAICCGDLHLQAKSPLARSEEKDWYAAMLRPVLQLKKVAQTFDVPILCAGDVFDQWNSPPELINFAIEHLPHMYAVPGQHDLPMHRYDLIHRSAYWTLVQAGKITNVNGLCLGLPMPAEVYGLPWGGTLPKLEPSGAKKIILVHHFIWASPKNSFPGASEDTHITRWKQRLSEFDLCLFGDNHFPICSMAKKPYIWNSGTFQRRHRPDFERRPRIGLILRSLKVTPHYLDTAEERYQLIQNEPVDGSDETDFTELLGELSSLTNDPLDFLASLNNRIRNLPSDHPVRAIIAKATS